MALPMFDKNDPRYQQLLAQMARSGNIEPMTMESQVEGILNPSGMAASGFAKDAPTPDPQGSIEGRQRISDNQRKYAQSLRGGAMPQGRTAGPLNVYYGPNIGESLGYAGKQLMGGYMEGQANKKDASIDEARQLEKALALKAANEQQAFENKYKTDTLGEAVRGNLVSEGQGAATLTLAQQAAVAEAKKLKVAQDLAAAKQDFTEAEGDLVGWQSIENPEDIVYKFEDKKGTPWNKDGETLTSPFDTTGYMKFDSGTGGSTTAAATLNEKLILERNKQGGRIDLEGVKKEDREELAILNSKLRDGEKLTQDERQRKYDLDDIVAEAAITTGAAAISAADSATAWGRALERENMYDATGKNPQSLATGWTGFAWGEGGGDVQVTQQAINKAGFEGAAADFKRMKLGQISKPEFNAVVGGANIDWRSEPIAVIESGIASMPLYRRALQKSEDEGVNPVGFTRAVMNGMEDKAVLGAMLINPSTNEVTMTLNRLEERGIDVDAAVARLDAKFDAKTITNRETKVLKQLYAELEK